MATLETIKLELDKLAIAYRPAPTPDELDILAPMWAQDLRGVSDQALLEAMPEVRRRCKWFPTSAHVLEVAREQAAHARPKGELIPLPEGDTTRRESIERARVGVRRILDHLVARDAGDAA